MSAAIKDEISQLALAGRLKWMYTDYSGDILFADHKNPGELEYVVGLGIAVHIDTNGAYLTDERIKTIIESKFDAVSISIDAATNSIYQTIRIGAPHIDEIFDAILRLVAARKRGGRLKNLTISAGFTLMRSNIHELPLFVARAAQIGVDSIGCRHLEVYHSPMREESLFHDPHRFNLARGKALAVAASLGIQLNIGAELQSQSGTGSLQPCMLPWESVTVLGNGDVMACCVPGSKIGSTSDSTLEDIWNGERYRRLRQRVNSNNPPAICGSCQFRNAVNRFGEHNIFSRESTSDLCFEDEL